MEQEDRLTCSEPALQQTAQQMQQQQQTINGNSTCSTALQSNTWYITVSFTQVVTSREKANIIGVSLQKSGLVGSVEVQ